MNAETTSRFHSVTSAASRQRSVSRRSMSSSSRSILVGDSMQPRVGRGSDGVGRSPRTYDRRVVGLSLAAGERPAALALAGVGIAFAGALLASVEERSGGDRARSDAVVLAVGAAL